MNTATMALLVTLFIVLIAATIVGAAILFVNLAFSQSKVIAWVSRIAGVVLMFGFMYGAVYLKLM